MEVLRNCTKITCAGYMNYLWTVLKLRMRRYLCICMVMFLLLAGCGGKEEVQENAGESQKIQEEDISENQEEKEAGEASRELFAMDTYMTLDAYSGDAQEAVDQAAQEIERLDRLWSTGSSGEVYKINEDGKGTLSQDTASIVERSLELNQATDGLFNIAIYPVKKAWGFEDGSYQVPSDETLSELLKLADVGQIHYDKDTAQIAFGMEGMQIDLGGIAKGFTSNRIMDIFRECGVESGLVNLGGNVQALGTKTDGSLWRISVIDPVNQEDMAGILSVADRAVVTSGGYERYFEEDGITYHHIIDPRTGYPADSGLISVTIISADGTLADGLSTAFFIMGLDEACEYWRERNGEFDMVLVAEDGTLYVTETIAESFESENEITLIKKEG